MYFLATAPAVQRRVVARYDFRRLDPCLRLGRKEGKADKGASMSKKVSVVFHGGKRIDAEIGGHTVKSDQPEEDGGTNSAPTPSEYFLASIAACTGLYASGFCENRDIPIDDLSLDMEYENDEKTHMVTRIVYRLRLPPEFPEKYRKAIVRAMEKCYVKKHLMDPPDFETVIED